MSQQQPAPPADTPLSSRDDKETLALLSALDGSIDALETQVVKLKEQRAELRVHLGNRLAGDLRPRVLEGIEAKAALVKLLEDQSKAIELQAQLKKAMSDKGIKLP